MFYYILLTVTYLKLYQAYKYILYNVLYFVLKGFIKNLFAKTKKIKIFFL